MSKELPYFKFYVNEWITGDITLEDFDVQGLFANICAYYWSKECKLTFTNCKKKFKNADNSLFETLISTKIMKVDSKDNLLINFLLEQKVEYDLMCKRNKINGDKGGRPAKENNPLGTHSVIFGKPTHNPNITNIEEKRRDKKIVDDETPTPAALFSISQCRINYEKNFNESISQIKSDHRLNDDNFILVLNKFDTHLISEGKLKKEFNDYAKHFSAWIKKFDFKSLIQQQIKKPPLQNLQEKYK